LGDLLRRLGLIVHEAPDAGALDRILVQARQDQTVFGLVLLDRSTWDLEKFASASWLRGLGECANAVIAVYADAELPQGPAWSGAEGADACLSGPMDEATLRRALADACRRRNADGAQARPEPPAALEGLSVLLVEDNPVNQEVAMAVLESWGHRVTVVGGGAQALAACAGEDFDLAFMDVQMPQMDGLETTRRLRQTPRDQERRLPIIAMTAHARDRDRKACLDAGMDGYVCKPVRPESLQMAIQRTMASAGRQHLARSPSPDPSAPWDPRPALEYVRGSEELLANVVQSYLDHDEPALANAVGALRAGQLDPVRAWAHNAKSILGVLGALQAQDLAIKLEEFCEQDQPERARVCLGRLEDQLRGLHVQLQAWIKENQHASARSG
jgi:CheY-like chemotaxis protein